LLLWRQRLRRTSGRFSSAGLSGAASCWMRPSRERRPCGAYRCYQPVAILRRTPRTNSNAACRGDWIDFRTQVRQA
jgi:hypothetical protein